MPNAPMRKRMKRREIPGSVRFVTFSCYKRLPLLGHPRIRDLFVETMGLAKREHRFELFAWVVMPEHAHLMVRPYGDCFLEDALTSMKVSIAKQVLGRWKRIRARVLGQIKTPEGRVRFWQKGGGFDRNVRSVDEFSREVCYIHRNPVERGLVLSPEGWAWSSVHWWMGHKDGQAPCDPPPYSMISWEIWTGFK